MKITTAKVVSMNERRITGRSDVEGSKDEDATLCNVRLRSDVQLYLTKEQIQHVNKGDFEITDLFRVKFDDDRMPNDDSDGPTV